MAKVPRAERAGGRTQAALLAGLLLGAAFASLLAFGPAGAAVGNENVAFYASWPMDLDRNRLDDRLDADLAAGRAGEVILHLHYDHHPTGADAAWLATQLGAWNLYVAQNWDDIEAWTSFDGVAGVLQAPGVVAVERFDPPQAALSTSAANVRARSSTATGLADGFDHSLGVHERLGLRGEGMVIAIVDTGVDNTHLDLDDLDDDLTTLDPKLVQKPDPVTGAPLFAGIETGLGSGTSIPCVDPVDDYGHGTHVASIASGTGHASQGERTGMAPKARLVDVSINSPGSGSGVGMTAGLDFLISFNKGTSCYGDPGEDRIDVASMSFSSGGDNPTSSLSRKITDVVRAGITFTQSAGNGGSGAETLVGGAEGAIYVGSSSDAATIRRGDDTLSGFSSRGPREADGDADTLDELRPDIVAPGSSITAANYLSVNGYTTKSGTSMSAPHIGGIAALMLQADSGLRPVDKGSNTAMGDSGAVPIRDLLQLTAQYRVATGGTAAQQFATGKFGLPWNNAWGYGHVDAYAAVLAAAAAP